jgi:CO/xanthine dehydrogenase Mo-binding subunit
MTAISSFRPASSATPSRCGRGSGSIGRSGKILAFAADHILDGGGLANFSLNVATVGATAAIGIYDVPKVDVTTVAVHSRGVTAGSMRGYGTLQTMTALEALVDEVAAALPLDPIEFRRRNALAPTGRTMTGNPYGVSVRTTEILDKLEKHPIWQQRAQQKSACGARACSSAPALLASTRTTGTGADCSLGRVELVPRRQGSRSIAITPRWATASAPRSRTGGDASRLQVA